ncbi:pdxK [Mytilus coruscus]|uniref:Pyridoxal kinase n=1 Tax=Mytilus coruscus TaxID=42192 RepID=A0A6J8AYR0_MYTCO|nr:pdxK [Mytilus coruscus]
MPPSKKLNPTKRKSRFQPYSTENVVTKTNSERTKTEMADELSKIGFKVPTNLTLNVVKTLYTENIGNKNSDDRAEAIDNTLNATDSFPSDTQTVSTETQNRESIHTSSATGNVNTNILVAAFNTMPQCANGLQKSVDTLMTEKLYNTNKPYNLHQWYNSSNTAQSIQNTPDAVPNGFNRTGVRSDDFPNVGIVSTALQKQIIHGKDINLASLLIPCFESPQSHTILADGMEINVGNKPDPLINRLLTGIHKSLRKIQACNDICFSKSFRIGAGTAAGQANIEDHMIKTLGRIGKFKGQVLNDDDVDCLYEGLKENNIHNFTHLLTEELLSVYKETILPLADIITPNQNEAVLLTGRTINNDEDALLAMEDLHNMGPQTVVISRRKLGSIGTIMSLAITVKKEKKETNIYKQVDMAEIVGQELI